MSMCDTAIHAPWVGRAVPTEPMEDVQPNPIGSLGQAARSDDRVERDSLGSLKVPQAALHGIHTMRALENFPLSRRPVHRELACAYGAVKLACAQTNHALGAWADDPAKAAAILQACRELATGQLAPHIVVDALQGGAGTSTNMNVNEVLANRALEILGQPHGAYDRVSPLDDLNRHQSTNDTYPTALKLAAIRLLRVLESRIVALQEAFQSAEKRFAHVVKVGRTQMQDAVLTTLGREMGAYAEALARDRWRLYKCEERLRVVNLGGTAIGTGLAAPRQYIFRVVDSLRELSGIGFARAENLVDATQNLDVFVEVSGILKAHATSLVKICGDLRLLASGPEAGLGELRLPARQAGSSIMPGKVNPVIPEAVTQVALLVMSYDAAISMAAAMGSLELNPFLPLIAQCLLEGADLLGQANWILREHCVAGMQACESRCRQLAENSIALATALLPSLSYERLCQSVSLARQQGKSIKETVVEQGWLAPEQVEALTCPEAVCRLGSPEAAP
jgi:aspartate ammonia-lyase